MGGLGEMWNNPNPYGGPPPGGNPYGGAPPGGNFPGMSVAGSQPAFDAFPPGPGGNPYGGAPPGGNPYGGPPPGGNPYGGGYGSGGPPPSNPYGGGYGSGGPPPGGNPYGGAPPGGNPYVGAPPGGPGPYGGAPNYGGQPGYGQQPGMNSPMRAGQPSGSGQKKAVLVGINYLSHQRGRLKGCINDVKNMQNFLAKYGFNGQNVRVLTDDLTDASRQPTRANILRDLRWLVQGARPGDSLFFHFSGHGSQVVDTSGDEDDGMDETILPVDYNKAGQIIDDELHEILVAPLPAGCKLTSLMDCCHSGTGLDLPYVHNLPSSGMSGGSGSGGHSSGPGGFPLNELMGINSVGGLVNFGMKQAKKKKKKKKKKKYSNSTPGELPGTSKADVMLYSGCRDDQTSADTSIQGEATGAMTWAFTSALEKNNNLTYWQVLEKMRDVLNGSGRYTQVPQLSTGRPMDLNQRFTLN